MPRYIILILALYCWLAPGKVKSLFAVRSWMTRILHQESLSFEEDSG